MLQPNGIDCQNGLKKKKRPIYMCAVYKSSTSYPVTQTDWKWNGKGFSMKMAIKRKLQSSTHIRQNRLK